MLKACRALYADVKYYLHTGWRGLKRLFQVAIVGLVALYLFSFAVTWVAPTYKLGYFLKYSIYGGSTPGKTATWNQVFVSPQPHDCEWETAPLGSKHCHYDPAVQTIRASVSKNGQLIVSYDEGKTWQIASGDEQPAIYVTWQKVEE
jgi:hypothetical protein